MDEELRGSKVGEGFVKAEAMTGGVTATAAGPRTEIDDAANLLCGLMESVGSQAGAAGPVSNLLGDMGVTPPVQWFHGEGEGASAADGSATDVTVEE